LLRNTTRKGISGKLLTDRMTKTEPTYNSIEEFQKRGTELFGDPKHWHFQCPVCGNVTTPTQFTDLGADAQSAAQQCIGRHLPLEQRPRTKDGQPCNYAAYGLFQFGDTVRFDDGNIVAVFPFYEPALRVTTNNRPEEIGFLDWILANKDNEEIRRAVPRILDGEVVQFGGGAAPLVEVQIATG